MNSSENPGEITPADLPAVQQTQPVPVSPRPRLLTGRVGLYFWKNIRKIVVLVIGATVILAGIAMLVLPGPGWLTIYVGVSILASEFLWAKWVLSQAQSRLKQLMQNGLKKPSKPSSGS